MRTARREAPPPSIKFLLRRRAAPFVKKRLSVKKDNEKNTSTKSGGRHKSDVIVPVMICGSTLRCLVNVLLLFVNILLL